MEDSQGVDLTEWKLRTDVDPEILYSLLESVMEIAQALQELTGWRQDEASEEFSVPPPQLILITKRISLQLRKLLLDGNGWLLKRCVADPNIHPLVLLHSFLPKSFVQQHEELSCVLRFDDGTTKRISRPALSHTITVFPVYCVHHAYGSMFELHNPFDYDSDPIKFSRWMNTKIVEVDSLQFKAEQLLRIMSDKEGAHSERNSAAIVPGGVSVETDNDYAHGLFNGIKFGSLTYLQIFSLFTGLYIASRVTRMLAQSSFPRDNESLDYICNSIAKSPRQIPTGSSEVSFDFELMIALGRDLEPRGNYANSTESYIRGL